MQWFSVPISSVNNVGGISELSDYLFTNGLYLVEATRNDRKLRIGAISCNKFIIDLSFESSSDLGLAIRYFRKLQLAGCFGNYFGFQRFGIINKNHEIGYYLLVGKKSKARRLMKKAKIPYNFKMLKLLEDSYLSYLFNLQLSLRIPALGCLKGDICSKRLNVPTGIIFGYKTSFAEGFQGDIERHIFDISELTYDGLKRRKISGARRPLFIPFDFLGLKIGRRDNTLKLEFKLPKGSYASSLLREISKNKKVIWFSPSSSS